MLGGGGGPKIKPRSYYEGSKCVFNKAKIAGAQHVIGAKVDGMWGPKSRAALRKWQRKQGVPVVPEKKCLTEANIKDFKNPPKDAKRAYKVIHNLHLYYAVDHANHARHIVQGAVGGGHGKGHGSKGHGKAGRSAGKKAAARGTTRAAAAAGARSAGLRAGVAVGSKALGVVALAANVGHSVYESRKDWHKIKDAMRAGEPIPKNAIRDLALGLTTDLIVGKGNTVNLAKFLGESTAKAVKALKNCRGRGAECRRKMAELMKKGLTNTASAIRRGFLIAKQKASKCVRNPRLCARKVGQGLKKAGQTVVSTTKAVGTMISDWWKDNQKYNAARRRKLAREQAAIRASRRGN